MLKIFFSHGYFLEEDPKERRIMRPYPPLGILYLSAWLERHGYDNEVFDTTFSSGAALRARLLERQPHVVALYTNLMTKIEIVRLMRFMRGEARLRETLIVLGGPDATYNATEYINEGADLIVMGEGEQTMLEIVSAADAARQAGVWPERASAAWRALFQPVAGLAFLFGNDVFRTAPREKIRSLDDLPLPARHKIDLNLYLEAWKKTHGQSALSLSTQRGCPYTCRWCSTAVYGQSYRRRSPEAVVEEIAYLQQHYDFDLIWFVDDVFTVSHKWLQGFHDALQARGVKTQFECITRADRLDENALNLLKACGCFRVWIGAESGSQRIIDAMDRRVDVGQVRDMIRAARRVGIQTGTFIMLGYPGETEADIVETAEHLKQSNPDLFTITIAYPIKGTGLYERVENSLYDAGPWAERTDRDLDFPRAYARRYYDYAVRWTVNSVAYRQAQLRGEQWRPAALKMLLKSWIARAGMRWERQKSGPAPDIWQEKPV